MAADGRIDRVDAHRFENATQRRGRIVRAPSQRLANRTLTHSARTEISAARMECANARLAAACLDAAWVLLECCLIRVLLGCCLGTAW
eukprot:8121031-Lingulodinium_polyedra.AAC.1